MEYNSIETLRKILVEELSKRKPEQPVLLQLDESLLQKLFFEDGKFAESLKDVLHLIDFSNVSFDNFKAHSFDFSGLHGVKINPQTVLNKDLSESTFQGVEFIGPFDGAYIAISDFSGSKGAKINPQTVLKHNLGVCVFSNVEFIGPFDGAYILRTNFRGSKGAKINPQTVLHRSLYRCECCDVEFIGPFDGADIRAAKFKGSKGAKINPQTIKDKHIQGGIFCDVEFIGSFNGVYVERDPDFTGSNYDEIVGFEEDFRQRIGKSIK